MAINYSTLLRLPKPDAGTQTWATYFHRLADILDKFSGDIATVTQTTGSVTLTDADGTADTAKCLVIKSSQVLTGNLTVVVPTRKRLYLIHNNSTGAFTMTVKTASGTGVAVKQGRFAFVFCDGTNVVQVGRLSGLITATEYGVGLLTATNIVANGPLAAGSIINSLLATGAVKKANLFGATGGAGVIRYTSTGAGNPWLDLLRGTARQGLMMSTAAQPKPVWGNIPFSRVATSTGITIVASTNISFTHGLSGIAANLDIRLVRLRLVCLSTDLGYAAGDVVEVDTTFGGNTTNNTGIHALIDGITTVKAVIGASGFRLMNKSTQSWSNADPTKWAIYFYVYA